MGIDGISREVIDQIGLEYDRLATDIERKKPQSLSESLIELLLRVLFRVQNGDARSFRAPIDVVFRQEKRSRNGSPGA